MQLVGGFGGYALAFGHGYARDPHDLVTIADDGQTVAQIPGHMGVDQDVLEAFWTGQAEGAHSIPGLAGGDSQRQGDEVGIEMTDRILGLEASGIATARTGSEPHA